MLLLALRRVGARGAARALHVISEPRSRRLDERGLRLRHALILLIDRGVDRKRGVVEGLASLMRMNWESVRTARDEMRRLRAFDE